MARKAKGPGYTPRSGKSPLFKHMGSSPAKYTNPVTGEELNPYAPGIIESTRGMGVSSDVMEEIIKNKTKKTEEKIVSGQKIDTKTEVNKSVKEVDKIEKIKPKKVDMDELRAKQKRSSKGQSEFEYRKTKEYKDSKKVKDNKPEPPPVDLTKKTTGLPVETGAGGASSTPAETSGLSFNDVFAEEYEKQGPGGKFEYKGNMYTTDKADDKDYGKYKHTDEIIKNFKKPEVEEVSDYSPKITDEFNNPIFKKSPSKKSAFKMKNSPAKNYKKGYYGA